MPAASPAQPATTLPEGVVKRPDGSVVYAPPPAAETGSRSDWWQRESEAQAAARERQRLDASAARQERAEQILRDREAAQSNPARQRPPSQKNY